MRVVMCALFLLLLFDGLLAPPVARADIYRYVDKSGVVHFTNTPTTSKFVLYRRDSSSSGNSGLGDVIRRYASINRIEEALVRAVIKAESDFNPRARSSKGALGMMQLIPATARDLKVNDPFDPEQNIRGGSRYLRLMLDQFDNNLELALAAYNAGPNAVIRHGGIPPYPETIQYVGRVKNFLKYYRKNQDALL